MVQAHRLSPAGHEPERWRLGKLLFPQGLNEVQRAAAAQSRGRFQIIRGQSLRWRCFQAPQIHDSSQAGTIRARCLLQQALKVVWLLRVYSEFPLVNLFKVVPGKDKAAKISS